MRSEIHKIFHGVQATDDGSQECDDPHIWNPSGRRDAEHPSFQCRSQQCRQLKGPTMKSQLRNRKKQEELWQEVKFQTRCHSKGIAALETGKNQSRGVIRSKQHRKMAAKTPTSKDHPPVVRGVIKFYRGILDDRDLR